MGRVITSYLILLSVTCVGEEIASPLEMLLVDEEKAAASDVFRREVTAVALWSVAIAAIVTLRIAPSSQYSAKMPERSGLIRTKKECKLKRV